MRSLILSSIAVLALAGGASAQMTTKPAAAPAKTAMTPAKPMAAKSSMSAMPARTASPAAPATPAAPAKAKMAKTSTGAVGRKPMTPESQACSAQADAKSLHGKEREKFRRACMKAK